jgi:hypothetical protein
MFPASVMTSFEKRGLTIMTIGGEKVPTFAVNMKHTAESCPLFNAEVKKRFKEMLGKREEAWYTSVECLDFSSGPSRFLHC